MRRVETIWVDAVGDLGFASAAADTLIIDEGGGRFEPGTDGPSAGAGRAAGGGGAEAGEGGDPSCSDNDADELGFVNLNGDADADIYLGEDTGQSLPIISVFGRGGNEVVHGE